MLVLHVEYAWDFKIAKKITFKINFNQLSIVSIWIALHLRYRMLCVSTCFVQCVCVWVAFCLIYCDFCCFLPFPLSISRIQFFWHVNYGDVHGFRGRHPTKGPGGGGTSTAVGFGGEGTRFDLWSQKFGRIWLESYQSEWFWVSLERERRFYLICTCVISNELYF